jgi:hypothetical protein
MSGTRADEYARLRQLLAAAPVACAYAAPTGDNSAGSGRKARRVFAQSLREGMAQRLGPDAFWLDCSPVDVVRPPTWRERWTRWVTEASAIIVAWTPPPTQDAVAAETAPSAWWPAQALAIAQRHRADHPQIPLILLLAPQAAAPALDPAPTIVLRTSGFGRLGAARLAQPLTDAVVRATRPLAPVAGLAVVPGPEGAPFSQRCPCGAPQDIRAALQAWTTAGLRGERRSATVEMAIPCRGHQTLVRVAQGHILSVERSDAAFLRSPVAGNTPTRQAQVQWGHRWLGQCHPLPWRRHTPRRWACAQRCMKSSCARLKLVSPSRQQPLEAW